jgi:pimeloyl-ACP methyl ester carboxylesterase
VPTPSILTVSAPDGTRLRVQVYAAATAVAGLTGSLPGAPPGSSPTVVLAHGWTLTHASWLPVVDRLTEQGLRVVTWDQRGHGRSGHIRGPATERSLGDDLAAVLAVVAPDGPLVLGGHSMGGMTVMAYAGLHPREFTDRVTGVVLVSTVADSLGQRLPVRTGRVMKLVARLPRIRAGRFVTLAGQRRLLFGPGADAAHVVLTREQVAATTLPTMGRFYQAIAEHDEARALSHLDGIPTVVLVGDRDRLTPPRDSERIAELVPHAQLRLLPGRGHMLAYEATDEVVDAFRTVLGTPA